MEMPSVERFDDTDFNELARKRLEFAAECAICLANMEAMEDGMGWPAEVRALVRSQRLARGSLQDGKPPDETDNANYFCEYAFLYHQMDMLEDRQFPVPPVPWIVDSCFRTSIAQDPEEWMGYFLLRESMLDSVLVARDRFLKPGRLELLITLSQRGALFPSHATLFLAPVGSAKTCREKQETFEGERQISKDTQLDGFTGFEAEQMHRVLRTRSRVAVVSGRYFNVMFRGSAQNPTKQALAVALRGTTAPLKMLKHRQVVELTTAPCTGTATHWGQQFNGAMAACSKVGRWQLSGFLLDDMAATRPKPSEFSFGTAIDSCSCHTDLWDVALVMLEEAGEAWVAKQLTEAKLKINTVILGAAVSACDKAQKWQEALHLLHQMALNNLVPDSIAATAALSSCAGAGQWELALAFFNQICMWKLTIDEVMYSCCIKACAKGAQADKSFQLLTAMLSRGIVPNEICYTVAWPYMPFLFVEERLFGLSVESGCARSLSSHKATMASEPAIQQP
eukprot:Skav200281  [mRNA]  locus=scaffold718:140922:152155:- [translate_table: standard]